MKVLHLPTNVASQISVTVRVLRDIGVGATILPGVRIGEGSIVGAGSVVNKNVPPYRVVAGVPAQLVRKRKD